MGKGGIQNFCSTNGSASLGRVLLRVGEEREEWDFW